MSSLLINHQSSALYLFVIVLLLIMVIIVHIWSSLKSKAWQLPAPARVCVALYSRFTRVVWYTYLLLLYCICTRIADEWFEISIYIYNIEIRYISWLQHLSTLLVHVPANRFLPWSHKFIGIDVNWDWCSGHINIGPFGKGYGRMVTVNFEPGIFKDLVRQPSPRAAAPAWGETWHSPLLK